MAGVKCDEKGWGWCLRGNKGPGYEGFRHAKRFGLYPEGDVTEGYYVESDLIISPFSGCKEDRRGRQEQRG